MKFKGDKTIWIFLAVFAAISILFVFSSTYRQTMRTGILHKEIMKHILTLFVGFAAAYIFHRVPFRIYKRFAPIVLLLTIAFLFVMFIISLGSSNRWLLDGSIQPSELAKIVMIVYLAKVLSEGFKSTAEFVIKVLAPVGIICMLILNGHTSAVVMIGITSLCLILMGTSNRKYITITLLSIMLAGTLYLTFDEYLGRGETAKNRVMTWISPILGLKGDVKEDAQAKTAKRAMVSGGVIGQGPGRSVYRKTLAEAHNDYIYAIIVEEYGTVGGIAVIILYIVIFYRVIVIIRNCDKPFPALLSMGLILMIILQAFVHIGVSVGGLPATGQNLPMLSTGGSSILTTGIAFGIILSVSNYVEKQGKKEL
ncbi:MAG: FtsW/RodA/SpoVE family cell cycle protein [Prevotellaceae bacterium]|jgi:cell division protein FtsW|nr:FtsW/RodA/SpoVE family cell cycle protein [Prevotellaceae bacterium]